MGGLRISHRVFLPASDALGTTRKDPLPLERPIGGGLARGRQFAVGVPPRSHAQRRRFGQDLKPEEQQGRQVLT